MSESIFNFFTTTKNSILEQQILMSKVDNVEDKFIDLYKKSFENVKSYFYLLKDQTFGSAESARLTEASASILPSIFTCMLKNCNDKDKDEIQKILKNYKHFANLSFCDLIFYSIFDSKDDLPSKLRMFIEENTLSSYNSFRFGIDPKTRVLDFLKYEKYHGLPFFIILREIYKEENSVYESNCEGLLNALKDMLTPLEIFSLEHPRESKKTISLIGLFIRILEANKPDNNTLFNKPLSVYQEFTFNIQNIKDLINIFSFNEAFLNEMVTVRLVDIPQLFEGDIALVELVSDVKRLLKICSLSSEKTTKSQRNEYHRIIRDIKRLYLTYVKDHAAGLFIVNSRINNLFQKGDKSKETIRDLHASFLLMIILKTVSQAFDFIQKFLSQNEESCIEEQMQFLSFYAIKCFIDQEKKCSDENWEINGIYLDSLRNEIKSCSSNHDHNETLKLAIYERIRWSNWNMLSNDEEKNHFSLVLNFLDDVSFSSKPKGSDFESYDLKISHHPLRLRLIYKIFLEKANMEKFSSSLKSLLHNFRNIIEEIEKTRVTQEIKLSFQKKIIELLSPLVFECICYNFAKEIWLYPQSDETEDVFPDELLSLLQLHLNVTEEASSSDVNDYELNLSADLELSETTIQKTTIVAQQSVATSGESSSKASALSAKAARPDIDDTLEKEEQLQKLRRLRKLNDICKVLKYLGYKQESSKRGKGSHTLWTPETGGQGKVVVPHHYELAKGTVHSIADTVEKSLQLK